MTMPRNNFYPLDILAISPGELREWRENVHFVASMPQAFDLINDVKESYYAVIRKYSGTEVGDVLSIKIKIYSEYRILLLALWHLQFIARNHQVPRCSEGSQIFKGILNNGVPLRKVEPYSNLYRGGLVQKLRTKAKRVLGNIKHNRDIFFYLKWLREGHRIATQTKWVDDYALENIYRRQMKKEIYFLSDGDWFADENPAPLSGPTRDVLEAVCRDVVAGIAEVAARYQISLDERARHYIEEHVRNHLTVGFNEYRVVAKIFARTGPFFLLGQTQSNHFTRLIGVVNRKFGGELVTFNHGNHVAHLYDYRREFSHATKFYTYTQASARVLEKAAQLYPSLHGHTPDIISLETRMYYDVWQKNRALPLPAKIKKVMLVSTFYKVDGLSIDCDLPYLEMELRLVDLLRQAGYQVLYKAHPDGYNRMINFADYLGPDVEIVRAPFEEVMNNADAILFYHYYTSTFIWSLCSNKPVILIDAEAFDKVVDQGAYPLLQKRCAIIKGWFDERNRYAFDERELLDALARVPQQPNCEFMEKYMFPRSVAGRRDATRETVMEAFNA